MERLDGSVRVRPFRAVWTCAVLAVLVVATFAGDPSEASLDRTTRAPIIKTKKIAPGVRYTKIVRRSVPLRVFALTLDLTKKITLDTTLADAALPSRRPLSRIVRSHDALIGVNGDPSQGLDIPGNTVHPFAQDGELLHSAGPGPAMFAVSRDETQAFIRVAHVDVTITDQDSGRTYTLDHWNRGGPAAGEFVGYSPLGGTLEPPPPYACSARLLPEGPPQAAAGDGVNRDFAVDVVGCSASPFALTRGVIMSAAPATDEATQLLTLAPGTPMRLHWTLGWPNVFDAVGGDPIILRDGSPARVCGSCARQPRTAVGVTASGKILLVVVDGRRSGWSVGATLAELTTIMRDLGAVSALNLDGGGASEMVVDGEIVNKPSDGRERPLTNAILVLPGPDPGE